MSVDGRPKEGQQSCLFRLKLLNRRIPFRLFSVDKEPEEKRNTKGDALLSWHRRGGKKVKRDKDGMEK